MNIPVKILTENDLNSSSLDQIILEYRKLCTELKKLEILNDKKCQEVYSLNKKCESAELTINELTSDYESLQKDNNSLQTSNTNLNNEIQRYKGFLTDIKNKNNEDINEKDKIIFELKKKIEGLNRQTNHFDVETHKYEDVIDELETEKNNLLSEIESLKELLRDKIEKINNFEENFKNLNDLLLDSNEKYASLKEELIKIRTIKDEQQMEITSLTQELNHMKNSLQTSNSSHAKKGNSLFAEVEDNRQKTKSDMIILKHHVEELERILAEKNQELSQVENEKMKIYEKWQNIKYEIDVDMAWKEAYERMIDELRYQIDDLKLEAKKCFEQIYKDPKVIIDNLQFFDNFYRKKNQELQNRILGQSNENFIISLEIAKLKEKLTEKKIQNMNLKGDLEYLKFNLKNKDFLEN